MLFRSAALARIAAGEVTCAFRRWRRPTVKAGGTLKTGVGLLAIEAVDIVSADAVEDADARAAGYDSVAALLADLPGEPDRDLYRIRFRLAGPDPRIALRERAIASAEEAAEIEGRLDRLDRASRHGPWTLRAIAQDPGRRAPDLAAAQGRDTKTFKADVRKLKALGLTESLSVGYRLSPRGRSFLDWM